MSDRLDEALLFSMEPDDQLKTQIIEVRTLVAQAVAAGRWTAASSFKRQEAVLLKELRTLLSSQPRRVPGAPDGGEDFDLEELVSFVESTLQNVPSHIVDRIGDAVDRLRRVQPVRLKLVPRE